MGAFGLWLGASAGYGQLPGAVFQQDPLADGVVSIEAEHYQGVTVGMENHTWELIPFPTFAGGQAMQALPNIGSRFNTGYAVNSPRLDYQVEFDRAGIHYIVIRGIGEDSSDDTLHAGLNGLESTTSDRITGFNRSSPAWSSETLDFTGEERDLAWLEVPSPGIHTVNIWMREDGIAIDKFILTTNPDFVPDDFGPAESPHGEGAGGGEGNPYRSHVVELAVAGGELIGSTRPAPNVDTYHLLQSPGLGSGWEDDLQAVFSGYSFTTAPASDGPRFYAVEAEPVDSNRQLTALVLNRLAYGPTPDELDRVEGMGPTAYIEEQLAPEAMVDSADTDSLIQSFEAALEAQSGRLEELRAWYQLRAIEADRQLLEVMTQFVSNHFVTYYWKTYDWFRDAGHDSQTAESLATVTEYDELRQWRDVLLDPNGTFYDLLKISVESPAMIIYLDTVVNEKTEPNENFARELLELFTQGVDNGYEQEDIEEMARVWTGWRVGPVHYQDVGDPFAIPYTNQTRYLSMQSPGWRYRKGTSEPAANWNQLGFEADTNWVVGTTSIGYGDGDDLTELADMRNGYSTVYLRHIFTIPDLAAAGLLTLRLYIDDGCVAWINGQEVARVSVPDGPLSHTGTAYNHEAGWEEVILADPGALLNQGTNNVLAIQALNQGLGSSDLSVDAELTIPATWAFLFDADAHDPSNKVIFAEKTVDPRFGEPWGGQDYELTLPPRAGTAGLEDGYDVIEHLADLPYTMEYVSVKLCRWFVNENFSIGNYYNISQISPEARLVRDCMVAWDTPAADGRKGNIRAVLGTLFASELFRGQAAMQQKVKTPAEYVHSAMRALKTGRAGGGSTIATDGLDLSRPMENMGMDFFTRFAPDGYPEEGHEWIDTGTITERLRFIQHLMMRPDDPRKEIDYYSWGASNSCDPVALVQARLPQAQWQDPEAITDLLLGLVFPGEGTANLALDRAECIQLLNSGADGVPGSSPFATVTDPTAYDLRVRSLAGLLLANPKFHEQ